MILRGGFSQWGLLAALILACCSFSAGSSCGNGQIEALKECDDNNTMSNDGCSGTCVVEDHYLCLGEPSDCIAILIDLNTDDNTSLDRDIEYFGITEPVFLVDEDMLDFFVRSANNWTHFDILILISDQETIAEQVGLDYGSNPNPPRPFMQGIAPNSDYPNGVNGRNVSDESERVLVNIPLPLSLTDDELNITLQAVFYQANEHPGYFPRDVCLVAMDPLFTTTACASLSFIGYNTNPPRVEYTPDSVTMFVEGQSEPVMIVSGSIIVTDDDHPTRYPIQSATAHISGFTAGSAEWLSLNNSYTLPDGITFTFYSDAGALSITGNASTEVYSDILQQLTYFNNMSQPHEFNRIVEVMVFDGVALSDPAVSIQIMIVNTNDNPHVSLDGYTPVITESTTSYTEGSGEVAIAPNIHVVDTDPNPMIISANVMLTNPIDGGEEVIDITNTMGLNLTASSHSLELSGAASPAVYTAALRTLTYHHRSANPGNPSLHDRFLEFVVKDDHNATSRTSVLTLTIVPVNDVPILSLISGVSHELYSYTEDDPAINIGRNITLGDVDSSILFVSLNLTNLLDGDEDSIGYATSVAEASAVTVTTYKSGTRREIVFSGAASDTSYTEILRSLTYINLHTNNSVTDGQRTILITATDTDSSTSLTLLIDVAERNDGPAIDLGEGSDTGFAITYTENGPSVGIGLNHLIEVMDEEGQRISSMDIELVSTNGHLDEGDLLLLRTPVALPFLSDPDTIITTTLISINLPGESSNYTDALKIVRYINTEDEPTLYVNGTRLNREIVIRVTDATIDPAPTTNEVRVTVEIEPINDNRPTITINSDPVCTIDYRSSDMIGSVSRRSIPSTVSRGSHRRRRRSNTFSRSTENVAVPQVLLIVPIFNYTNGYQCLTKMVVTFNTDTNAPVVEVQQELDSLLTFAPASLAKTPHHGYWRDYSTLVIVFRGCVVWELGDQNSRKPLYVVFYDQEGSCNWGIPCEKGVCYYNSSGCPVAGYYSVHTSSTNYNITTSDNMMEHNTYMSHTCQLVMILSGILLVALFTVCIFQSKRGRKEMTKKEPGQQKTRPVSSHIIDVFAPANTQYSTKCAIQSSTEKNSVRLEPLPAKEEHIPPSYGQTDIRMLTSTEKQEKTKHLPRKRLSHASSPDRQEKKAKITSDLNGSDGREGGGSCCVEEDEGRRAEEGRGRLEEEENAREYGENPLPLGGPGVSGVQKKLQARESIARAQDRKDSSMRSREHSPYTHTHQRCNNSRQHLH